MIRKFSLLEELELSECSGIYGNGSIEAIAKSCPQLNHFRMIKESYYPFTVDNDVEALAISGMHGLRSLELYHNGLTNNGLITILDNCVHLELLIIREQGRRQGERAGAGPYGSQIYIENLNFD